jgi:hypothetical protein
MAKKCLVEVKTDGYPDEKEKASKRVEVFKARVARHFFGPAIPWQVASPQSLPPFHRTGKA